MASRGLWGAGAGKHSEGCSRELCEAKMAWRWTISMPFPSPCHFRLAARPGCSLTAFIAASAAEPEAGGQPVSIVKNVSDDLLDGGAEPHHLTDDAGDRAGSLDDDEQRSGGAARSALALLAPPCGVG